MNKAISFLVFTCYVISVFSQSFPLQGNEQWYYTSIKTFGSPHSTTVSSFVFYNLKGDSIIDNKKWFKVFSSEVRIYNDSYPPKTDTSYLKGLHIGYIREEGNVWLYKNLTLSNADTISNFSLKVGQIFFKNANCETEFIDTSGLRKVWKMFKSEVEEKTKLIEGIGFVYSLLPTPECINCYSSSCYGITTLGCFTQNGINVFNSSCGSAEKMIDLLELKTSNADIENQILDIKVNSIVANDFLTFYNLPEDQQLEIDIYNFLGRPMLSSVLGIDPIDISNFISGPYFFRIKNKQQLISTGKFIKL